LLFYKLLRQHHIQFSSLTHEVTHMSYQSDHLGPWKTVFVIIHHQSTFIHTSWKIATKPFLSALKHQIIISLCFYHNNLPLSTFKKGFLLTLTVFKCYRLDYIEKLQPCTNTLNNFIKIDLVMMWESFREKFRCFLNACFDLPQYSGCGCDCGLRVGLKKLQFSCVTQFWLA
jgi:hypothetical protein